MPITQLQVGDLNLKLVDGEAKHSSPTLKTLPQVEARLQEVQEFLDEWLQAAEPPPKLGPTPEEERMTEALLQVARGLRKSNAWRRVEDLALILPGIAVAVAKQWESVSEDRAKELAQDVLANLR